MNSLEYMLILYSYIPTAIRDLYNLDEIVIEDGYLYIKIKKGVYGLKQVALLAFNNMIPNLLKHGYSLVPNTTSIW